MSSREIKPEWHIALEDFLQAPSRLLIRSGGKYREGFAERRELNAQFKRYSALEANEPIVSGYATFLVAVKIFGWVGRGMEP